MGVLTEVEPNEVFKYFDDICSIPRPSYNEKAISDYLVDFAGKQGLIAYRDSKDNVVIIKPATEGYEDKDTIVLQAHIDMVCVAEDGNEYDFNNKGIEPFVEGDFICAKGTSLGADDGIGVAMILAILAAQNIPHPMIEAVFTTCEEVGLEGANGLDVNRISGRKLINIDSEEENHIITGCAGGDSVSVNHKCKTTKMKGNVYNLSVSGCSGGHSGSMIFKGSANANVIIASIIYELSQKVELGLIEITGGTKDNAICNFAQASFMVKKKQGKDAEKIVEKLGKKIFRKYNVTDPEIKVELSDCGKDKKEVMGDVDFEKLMCLLNATPNGVSSMSNTLPGMVESSSNLGILKVKPKSFAIDWLVRGNMDYMLDRLSDKFRLIGKALDVETNIVRTNPAWECTEINEFAQCASNTYQKLFGEELPIESVHAGLECAILCNKIPNLCAISIGPWLYGAHTTQEKLSISSVQREWKFIKELLKA